jgi:hypothetical protein
LPFIFLWLTMLLLLLLLLCCCCCPVAVLVAWRSRRSTSLRLFAPFIFLLLALIVNLALNANNALQVWGTR